MASSSGTNLRSSFIGMGFAPSLVDKAIEEHGLFNLFFCSTLKFFYRLSCYCLIELFKLSCYYALMFLKLLKYLGTKYDFRVLDGIIIGEGNHESLLETLFAYSVSATPQDQVVLPPFFMFES